MLAAVEQLEVRTVTEIIEDWVLTYRVIPIIAEVELHVYDESKQAVLKFNDSAEIEFSWTPEASAMFDNIDVADPVEFLELLARLNRKLEADSRAIRKANGLNF